MRLSSDNRTTAKRRNSPQMLPREYRRMGPGWQEAEGLGVSHTSNAISVEGRMPALDEYDQPNLPWEP